MKYNFFYLKTQFVPHSKQSLLVMKANQLMLYRPEVTVISGIPTKRMNARCGLNVEFFIVAPGVKESDR
jgi:hypothetical protein